MYISIGVFTEEVFLAAILEGDHGYEVEDFDVTVFNTILALQTNT